MKRITLLHILIIPGFLLFSLPALSYSRSVSQTLHTIQGTVRDSSDATSLIGVTVYVTDLKKGTVTDADGYYRLILPAGLHVIQFTYTGYDEVERTIAAEQDTIVDVSLKPSFIALEEVQVIGQRKFFGNMEYGREIPSIGTETIENRNSGNASDLLHASVAGVWATKTSGEPGDHEKIRIRGQSSFFSSVEPLYIIDGVPVPIVNLSSLGIADLNTHDIAGITILRDASSTALYGFQGGNGVVLIDTRNGGKKEVNFYTRMGVQYFTHYYDLMSTEDFLGSLDLAGQKIYSNLVNYYPPLSDTLCNRDWQRYIFRTGFTQEYQLSGSGTTREIKYYLSGSYIGQSGILPSSRYDRYTVSAKLNRQIAKKIAVEVGYRSSYQHNKDNQDLYQGNRLLFEGITRSPCLECTPDNYIQDTMSGVHYTRIYYNYPELDSPELPQSVIDNNRHTLNIVSQALNVSARFQLTEHLNMNGMASLLWRRSDYNLKYAYYYYNEFRSPATNNILLESQEQVSLFNQQYNLSYNNAFDGHEVGIVAACRVYNDNLQWNVDTVHGKLNYYSYLRNSMAAYGPTGSIRRLLASWVGNASYSYRKRYFLSAVANLSRVREGLHTDYYSLFPSLAVSWDIAQEKLLSGLWWLNEFDLYVNWGRSGNYPLNGLANDLYQSLPYTVDGVTGSYPSVLQFANHYLKHESTEETNYGIKTSFLDHRLSVKATYYTKTISNLMLQRDIPGYYGSGKMFLNIGAVDVKGTDITIEARPMVTHAFSWDIQVNFSTSRQIVKKLSDGEDLTLTNNDPLMPTFILREGEALGNIYGYMCYGKWMQADELANDNHYLNSAGIKYLNVDSNNIINEADMVVLGNSIPKYTWNISNNFRLGKFGLDMLWYAVQGVKKINITRAATIMTSSNREVNRFLNDTLYGIGTLTFYKSSEFIDDAGFIRLKSIMISYYPSKEYYGRVKLKLSLSIENLITLTKYRGYDPEATIFTDNNFSDNAIDRGAVPNPKAVYVILGLTF